jgi:hypothetical protein
MTTLDIAAKSGASTRTVRWWIAQGWLRATPTTRGWVIAPKDWARCQRQHGNEMRPSRKAMKSPESEGSHEGLEG